MYVFIINPKAGNGKAKRIFMQITKTKLYQKLESKYYFTKYPGHGEEITKEIYSDSHVNTIIVIGGDGTVHEVFNGIHHPENTSVAVIPGGSGNDFARSCGIKGDPVDIFQQIVNGGQYIPYWNGKYCLDKQTKKKFVNSIGFGFDAQIAHKVNQSIYKHFFNRIGLGNLSYIIALIQVLFQFQPMHVEVEVDGKRRALSNCWMITCSNHPYIGGGMKIIPNAIIQPRQFSIIIIHEIPKWKVLTLFLTVFFGKHTAYKEVEIIEANSIRIISKAPLHVQVDGEVDFCTEGQIERESLSLSVFGHEKK